MEENIAHCSSLLVDGTNSEKQFDWKLEKIANNEKEESSEEEFDDIVDDETELNEADEAKPELEASVATDENVELKPELSNSSLKSNMQTSEQKKPTFGIGTLERPVVRFFFTSSCPPLGIEAPGEPILAGRPAFSCHGETFACNLCPVQLTSMAELVDHWRWEMEREGMEVMEVEEKEVPHAEVMPPVIEKQKVKGDVESGEDGQEDEEQDIPEVKDSSMEIDPGLCLKQEFIEGMVANLQKSYKKRSPEGPKKCDQCSYTCEKQDTLRMHKFRKHSIKSEDADLKEAVVCDECDYSCEKRDTLRMHKLRKHSERADTNETLSCDQCDYTCNRRDTLNAHKNRKHRGKGQKLVYCNECDYKCTKRETLGMHIYKQHNGAMPEAKQCDMCAFTCMTMSGLRQHKNFEHLGLTHNCTECEFSSRNKWTLANHEHQIHGKEFSGEKNIMCHLCDYRTYAASNLRNHLEVSRLNRILSLFGFQVKHSDRMYYCDKCDFKSPYKGSANSHKKIHDEDSWFQCEYCEYRCAAKGNLQTHMDGKHKDISQRSYPCPECDHISRTKPDLNSHKAAVHLNIRHKCEACDYANASRQMVKKHFIARHTNIRSW